MTKLLHPLPPSFAILAHAVASLEEQYLAINSIDTDKHPDLIKSRKDTLKYLDFEFEAINADIEFINLQTTKTLRFKTGGKDLSYPSYVAALEKCTELLIHMEYWAIWHKLKIKIRRVEGIKNKNLPNDLIYKKEIENLKKSLGRALTGHDYPKWKDQLLKNNLKQKVSKKTRKDPKDGIPTNPDPNIIEETVNDKWRDSTLRKKFKELTGCDAKTKKLSPLKS
jgi:hypothetical protein